MSNLDNILNDLDNENVKRILKKIYYYFRIEKFDVSEFCEFKEIDFKISPFDWSGKEIEMAFWLMFDDDTNIETYQFFIDNNMWKAFVRVYK